MPGGFCGSGWRSSAWRCTPTSTRLIEFGRYAAQWRSARGLGKPETFDFLGFTHICGKAKEGGWFTLVRHTIAKRMRAKLVEIKEALNRMRHVPVPEQGRWLGQVVRGYLAYHAVPTNSRKITSFHHFVVWHWRRALSRRSSVLPCCAHMPGEGFAGEYAVTGDPEPRRS